MSTLSQALADTLTFVKNYNSGNTFVVSVTNAALTNIKRDDWTALDAAGTNYAAVIEQGGPSEFGDILDERGEQGKRQQLHRIRVNLCRKVLAGDGGDGVAVTDLHTLVDNIIAYFDQYERMNGATNVLRAQVAEASDPAQVAPGQDVAPTHWVKWLIVEVRTQTAPVLVEVAR